MSTNKMIVVLTLGLIGFAYADVISSGPCPSDISVKPNFDVEKYLGIWYEFEKYPTYFEANGKCISAEYTLQDDGNVGVKNTMVDESTGESSDIVGYAVPVENAKLKVIFPVTPTFNATSNYWILDTDYTSFSVVYSCQPISSMLHSTIVWVLTRERIASADAVGSAENVLIQKGISREPLVQTQQAGCNNNGCDPLH